MEISDLVVGFGLGGATAYSLTYIGDYLEMRSILKNAPNNPSEEQVTAVRNYRDTLENNLLTRFF